MPQPHAHEVIGYDVVIWLDDDGDPILSHYSELGEKYIKSLIPDWDGSPVVIVSHDPFLFLSSIPQHLVAGVQNPETKIVHPTNKKVLQ